MVLGISALPEDCISHIISLTSPRDACRLSVIASGFRSAASSDTVWERFLPSDYEEIISTSVTPVLFSSKKDLYFHLCEFPILLVGGTKTFALDKLSGKKCYMLGARELSIVWGDSPRYWNWIIMPQSPNLPKSRFLEVAHLKAVCWLHIQGKIETRMLSQDTIYAAYLVYGIADDFDGLENPPVKVSVRFANADEVGNVSEGDANIAYLQDMPEQRDGQLPRQREDRWMELELGEFFNDQNDGVVEMCLRETEVLNWKSGLIVHGIEMRPKVQENN